ncbi:MAG TPA: hypothetical protein VMU16_00615, partial [Candidatus Binataceae bacterium]|nr:hypothetical protein [Candidatus Binataceae bacterium]
GNCAFFKRRALHYATFTGPPFFWNVAVVSHQVGTPCQEAVVNARDVLYFWGIDDFYTFDGYSLLPIQNNLREFIFRDLNKGFRSSIAGRYDENNGPCVFWHYPSNASADGSLDSYVCFNIRFGTWGWGRLAIDFPLLGNIEVASGPVSGVFLPDHALREYNPASPLASPYITTNTIGDGHYLYQINRARPRFSLYPFQAPLPTPTIGEDPGPFETYPDPGPSLGTVELTQLYRYIAGQPYYIGTKQAIDQDGWFNAPLTQRMQRLQLTVHDPCEIVELEVDLSQAGET